MTATDTVFAGSIPAVYDRYMVPLIFAPYAEEVARRARTFMPGHVLETAAGTGVVTEALHHAIPDAEIIATDLNEPMLDVAARRVRSDKVSFEVADAQQLRFADGSFDLVVCHFARDDGAHIPAPVSYEQRLLGAGEVLQQGFLYRLGCDIVTGA